MMKAQGGVAQGGQFEWVDSLLVQAITQGHWMLLSHANFCRYMIHTCTTCMYVV